MHSLFCSFSTDWNKKKHHIGDYKTYLLMVTTFSQVAYRIDQYTWEDNSHSPMKVI